MKTTEIVHPSELNALTAPWFLRRRGRGKISLANFKHADANELEKELNRQYYACACSTSASWLLIGIAIGIVYSAYGLILSDLVLANAGIVTVAAGIVGAVLGKVAGLYRARSKLLKTVHTIQALWKVEKTQEKELILCG